MNKSVNYPLTHLLACSLTHSCITNTNWKIWKKGATIPVEERTCLLCKENCVEHEQHFLMYCQGYATIRDELHSQISNKDALYANLSDNERTRYLLRADNKVTSKIIGK